jgi:small subunit ribosomal protein S4
MHPWNLTSIEQERKILKEYGLRNKKEILRANSFLKKYKNLAKKLIADHSEQGDKEKAQILGKLQGLGLLQPQAKLDDILGLQLPHLLGRRLQSILVKKGLARSMKQSRQFITHRHIYVQGRELSVPSYLVSLAEEQNIGFRTVSALAAETHPERLNPTEEIHKEAEKVKKSKPAAEDVTPEVDAEAKLSVEDIADEQNSEITEPVLPVETPAEPEAAAKEVPVEESITSTEEKA